MSESVINELLRISSGYKHICDKESQEELIMFYRKGNQMKAIRTTRDLSIISVDELSLSDDQHLASIIKDYELA